jgi:hypothetical protein
MRFAHLFSAVLLLSASAVFANDKLPIADNTYGTSGLTWVTFTPWDFHPINTATTYDYGIIALTPGIYSTGGTGIFVAGLHLPEGAAVSVIELAACDSSTTADVTTQFTAALKTAPPVIVAGFASTSGSAGCQVVSSAPFTPWTVNNDTTYYTVRVTFGANDSSLILNSVRVGYKLQVSPDSATATFADVPVGHPFHRFVEALYASGITGGCGGGNYCPDAPVTRGQMAVFLAGALGLHWAP